MASLRDLKEDIRQGIKRQLDVDRYGSIAQKAWGGKVGGAAAKYQKSVPGRLHAAAGKGVKGLLVDLPTDIGKSIGTWSMKNARERDVGKLASSYWKAEIPQKSLKIGTAVGGLSTPSAIKTVLGYAGARTAFGMLPEKGTFKERAAKSAERTLTKLPDVLAKGGLYSATNTLTSALIPGAGAARRLVTLGLSNVGEDILTSKALGWDPDMRPTDYVASFLTPMVADVGFKAAGKILEPLAKEMLNFGRNFSDIISSKGVDINRLRNVLTAPLKQDDFIEVRAIDGHIRNVKSFYIRKITLSMLNNDVPEGFKKDLQNKDIADLVRLDIRKLQKQMGSISFGAKVGGEAESPLEAEARKYKSAEEFVNKIANEAGVSNEAGIKEIPLNKISGTDYTELDNALKTGKLTEKEANDLIGRTDDPVVAGRAVVFPIEVMDGGDGTYALMGGNSRIAQAIVNGDKTILAMSNDFRGETLADFYNQAKGEVPKTQAGGEAETPESLLQEAKGAEEFVEALGDSLYRGGTPLDKDLVTNRGISFTKDKSIAEEFTTGPEAPTRFEGGEILKGGKGVTEEFHLMPDAKILNIKDIPKDLLDYYKTKSQVKGRELIVDWAKKNGYDVIDFTKAGDFEVRVLNPSVIKTKAQLTDIYNQAKGEVPKAQADVGATKEIDSILSGQDVKTKANLLDYMRTPQHALEKMGLGEQSKQIRDAYGTYLKELPQEIDKVTQWYNRVGKDSAASTRIFRALDGQAPIQGLPENEKQVALEIKDYLAQWADKLGLPQDARIANYITRLFDIDVVTQKEFDPEIAKMIRDKIPGSVYDPFLQKRLGALGYKEDVFGALDAYIKRAVRKVNMDPALKSLKGASEDLPIESWDYVKKYADRINMRPTDVDNLLDNLIKSSPIGYRLGQRPTANLTRKLRMWTYRGTLGGNVGSTLKNLTQGVNTYAKLGEKYTSLGYMRTIKDLLFNGKELEESRVLQQRFIQDRGLSYTKETLQKLDSALFAMFDMAEKINRGAAYFGAKQRALDQGGTLEQAIEAGRELARETQFTFGSVDTPVAMQADMVKFLTQFQSYNVKQAEFLLRMMKNKEFVGLIRWSAANLLIAATVGKLFGYEAEDALPFLSALKGESKIGSTPPIKLGTDIIKATLGGEGKYGQKVGAKEVLGDLVPFVPGGTQLRKTIRGLSAFEKGKSTTPTGRTRFKIPPTLPNLIRTGIFGEYSLPEARGYFDKLDGKKSIKVGTGQPVGKLRRIK